MTTALLKTAARLALGEQDRPSPTRGVSCLVMAAVTIVGAEGWKALSEAKQKQMRKCHGSAAADTVAGGHDRNAHPQARP
jgi:hypothetical protein